MVNLYSYRAVYKNTKKRLKIKKGKVEVLGQANTPQEIEEVKKDLEAEFLEEGLELHAIFDLKLVKQIG